jgi:hypothetical protein
VTQSRQHSLHVQYQGVRLTPSYVISVEVGQIRTDQCQVNVSGLTVGESVAAGTVLAAAVTARDTGNAACCAHSGRSACVRWLVDG